MSTAYAMPLHSVPNLPPTTQGRFAFLLAVRDAARRALDKALSLPRSAIRWAVSLFDRWVEATGSVGFISWLGGKVRSAAGLFRRVGIVPSSLALLSTPSIADAAAGVARFLGKGLRWVASTAWTGLKALLGRCGNTGTQIIEGLGRAGTQVADAFRAAASHPMMGRLAQGLDATLAFVRPVSWGMVTHRLLAALVLIVWLRTIFELLIAPFLIDTTLAGSLWDFASNPQADGDQKRTEGDTPAGLVVNGFGTPNGHVPSDNHADDQEPLNRASRRAQQREDAHARRAQHR